MHLQSLLVCCGRCLLGAYMCGTHAGPRSASSSLLHIIISVRRGAPRAYALRVARAAGDARYCLKHKSAFEYVVFPPPDSSPIACPANVSAMWACRRHRRCHACARSKRSVHMTGRASRAFSRLPNCSPVMTNAAGDPVKTLPGCQPARIQWILRRSACHIHTSLFSVLLTLLGCPRPGRHTSRRRATQGSTIVNPELFVTDAVKLSEPSAQRRIVAGQALLYNACARGLPTESGA